MKLLALILLLASVSCRKENKKAPDELTRLDELKAEYVNRLALAESVRDAATGWLARQDCDSMITNGKYASIPEVTGVNIEAAEYPGVPGKFGRRPPPWCWTPEQGDVGSKTEWSRDMFIAGLLPYIWRQGKKDILERHLDYGAANNWILGSPFDDGRVVYSPNLIGLAYNTLYAMGGELSPHAFWPSYYDSGLTDFQAHLQVMSIWMQGEVAEKLGDGDAIPQKPDEATVDKQLTVSIAVSMYERLTEHATREPACPLYQVVHAMYSGTMGTAIESLLTEAKCEYYRDDAQANLADWLFTASLALDHIDNY
jgi:hypothetical protein